jgi:hypothetical protein
VSSTPPQKVKHLLKKEFYKPDSSVPAATKTLTCVRAMLRKLSDTRPPSRATKALHYVGASMRDALRGVNREKSGSSFDEYL